jgi:hypothetical protein
METWPKGISCEAQVSVDDWMCDEREDLYSNMDVRTRCGTRKVAKRTTVKTTHIVVELHCI